ncbi:MAG: response regulator transcription factor [Asticcacaulis sp.]|nr:response regulator transcription factor [Asticcacaulis sp.]
MSGLSLLLVEDERDTAAIVIDILAGDGHGVTWRERGLDGLTAAGAAAFDVIILDRMLPDIGGLDIVKRLREAGIATPILMLSALSRSENRISGLEQGADDYLGKPFEPAELMARVRALHRRAGNPVHSAVMLYGDIELHVKARTAHRQGRHLPLSPKEFELLKFLMENAGEIVTRQMLLLKVWNLAFDPQTNVVDVNMSRLRRQLEEGFDTGVLETVRGMGFRLVAGKPTDRPLPPS